MAAQRIRRAELADADPINRIYNPYICESVATFEEEEYSQAQRITWLDSLNSDPRHPVFVAENHNGDLVGFANAAPFDVRTAYLTSVKVSVFVVPDHHGQGTAGALYQRLFEALSAQDVHRAYGLIVSPNQASEALHGRFGFCHVATLNEVGRKFGRYLDVKWYEKKLL